MWVRIFQITFHNLVPSHQQQMSAIHSASENSDAVAFLLKKTLLYFCPLGPLVFFFSTWQQCVSPCLSHAPHKYKRLPVIQCSCPNQVNYFSYNINQKVKTALLAWYIIQCKNTNFSFGFVLVTLSLVTLLLVPAPASLSYFSPSMQLPPGINDSFSKYVTAWSCGPARNNQRASYGLGAIQQPGLIWHN